MTGGRQRTARPVALVGYATAVCVAGGCAVAVVVTTALSSAPGSTTDIVVSAPLSLALLAGELLRVRVARRGACPTVDQLTVSSTFAVALVLTGQLLAAVLAQVAASILDDLLGRRRLLVVAFNASQLALTLLVVHVVHAAASGSRPLSATVGVESLAPGPALAAVATYFVVNHALVGVVVALDARRPLRDVVAENLRSRGLDSAVLLGLAPVAALVVTVEPGLLPLVVLPVLGVVSKARLAARSQHASMHDELTGLPNRSLLRVRAREVLGGRAGRRMAAVMIVDLDRFKDVNDSLGHHAGDKLLRQVADRMREAVPGDSTVARIGGDEFAVLVPGVATEQEATGVARSLLARLEEPVAVDGVLFGVRASIGVAVTGDVAGGPPCVEDLLRLADVALYRAKAHGGEVRCYRAPERGPDPDLAHAGPGRVAIDVRQRSGRPT